jgi:hypothetical protein
MTFYLTLLSDASLDLYPDNAIWSFRICIPRPVDMSQGVWEVGLCELTYPAPKAPGTEPQPVFVYCDRIGPQLLGDTLARCLRTVHYPSPCGSHVFDRVYYLPGEKTEFQTVALEVLTKLGERVPIPDSVETLVAVLHLRRWRKRV